MKMKKIIIISLLAYFSSTCSETKERNVSVADENTEAKSDSLSNEIFQIL